MGYKHNYKVYFKVGHPSDDFSKKEEQSQVLGLEKSK